MHCRTIAHYVQILIYGIMLEFGCLDNGEFLESPQTNTSKLDVPKVNSEQQKMQSVSFVLLYLVQRLSVKQTAVM